MSSTAQRTSNEARTCQTEPIVPSMNPQTRPSQVRPSGVWWLQLPAGDIELAGQSRIEDTYPTDGLFYCVRLPDQWLLASLLYSEFWQAVDHFVMWEHFVAKELAAAWVKRLATARPSLSYLTLHEELSKLPLAFHRGRVQYQLGEASDVPGVFNVYHGKDFPAGTDMSRALVERCFWVQGRARWVFEEHEQCRASQRDAMRVLLGLTETWSAVEAADVELRTSPRPGRLSP